MRDPYTNNAAAEYAAGKPRPKPCDHRTLVDLQKFCEPTPTAYCATCGRRQPKEPK